MKGRGPRWTVEGTYNGDQSARHVLTRHLIEIAFKYVHEKLRFGVVQSYPYRLKLSCRSIALSQHNGFANEPTFERLNNDHGYRVLSRSWISETNIRHYRHQKVSFVDVSIFHIWAWDEESYDVGTFIALCTGDVGMYCLLSVEPWLNWPLQRIKIPICGFIK